MYCKLEIIFRTHQITIIVIFHIGNNEKTIRKSFFHRSKHIRIKQALLHHTMCNVNTQMIYVCKRRDEHSSTAYPPAVMAGCIDRTKCSWKHDKLETLFARSFIERMACVRAYELANPPTLQRVLDSSLSSVSRNFVMSSLYHVS